MRYRRGIRGVVSTLSVRRSPSWTDLNVLQAPVSSSSPGWWAESREGAVVHSRTREKRLRIFSGGKDTAGLAGQQGQPAAHFDRVSNALLGTAAPPI